MGAIRAGVSTSCLFPMLTEQALSRLTELGVNTVEVFVNAPSERTPAFAKELLRRAEGRCRIVSVHPYTSENEGVNFFGRYERRFVDEAEDYRHFFEFCNLVGADLLVFHGARSFFDVTPSFYFERFVRLRDIARGFGVRLAQENVARCHSGNADFLRQMTRAIPDVDYVLDIKQAIRAQQDPLALLEAMGSRLAHLHLSDHSPGCDCLIPGCGELDLPALIAALQRHGFAGVMMLELYRWNFEDETLLRQGWLRVCEHLQKAAAQPRQEDAL